MTKKETTQGGNGKNWYDYVNLYNAENYQGYYRQWLDAWEHYNNQAINFHKTVIERTGQAWDEAYKVTREGFNRTQELVDLAHTMGLNQVKQIRDTFRF